MTRTAALLLCLLLAGCASTVSHDNTEPLDPKGAYALVSLSHSGYGWLESFNITYRKRGGGGIDDRTISIVPRRLFQDPESGVLLRDGSTRMIGELKLLSLAPGEYEFVTWNALASRGNVGLTIVSTSWRPVDPPPPLVFSVAPGRVTYIGNLDILIPEATRYRWRGLDARARDLELFEKRFAVAKGLPLDFQVMQRVDGAGGEFEGGAGN